MYCEQIGYVEWQTVEGQGTEMERGGRNDNIIIEAKDLEGLHLTDHWLWLLG